MQYMKVFWRHDSPDTPSILYCELDDDRWETRKVEIYSDGTKGYASIDETFGDTGLGIVQVPTLDEIAADPEFDPFVIDQIEFEDVWQRRKRG